MWNLLVISVLAAMTGVYTGFGQRAFDAADRNVSRETAESMALYREAVILYYTANDMKNHSVDIDVLKSTSLLPTWSTLYTRSAEAIWGNYRAADGTIYVYAITLPAKNMQAELVALSRNSILAGVYRRNGQFLYSPVFGDTGISLAALAGKEIPDNAPVWIGYRR